jgi:hypothetical protein
MFAANEIRELVAIAASKDPERTRSIMKSLVLSCGANEEHFHEQDEVRDMLDRAFDQGLKAYAITMRQSTHKP